MKIGVLGTGMVGRALGTKLVDLGHEVTMGSRTADNAAASGWAKSTGGTHGTFEDAARTADLVINATAGSASLDVLGMTGEGALDGKVLIDVGNAIAPDSGMPPSLSVCNTDSLGEQIQRAYPDAKVVKTLNTMNADVMVDPARVPGNHVVFLSGDDAASKATVTDLLADFGWPMDRIIDLGGIETARGTEMYLALWLRLWGVLGTGAFNISVTSADSTTP